MGITDGLTVDCKVFLWERSVFLICGVLSVGLFGEILGYVILVSVSTISLISKYAGFWIFCSFKFLVPFRVSCLFANFEFKLLLLVLSLNIAF